MTSEHEVPVASIFQSALTLEAKLEQARKHLLDLTARNRLLNIPRSARSARTIEVVDEKSVEVYRLLVKDGRALTFSAGKSASGDMTSEDADSDEVSELAQPDDHSVDARGVLNRHADNRLQTRLTSKALQKNLLAMYFDARTLEEEQGVNILFLALGTLKWLDAKDAKLSRYAPLVLIPVALERAAAGERFKLRWRQEDISSNLSLEAFLDREHALKLPVFDQSGEFDIGAYIGAVAKAVSSKNGWSVDADDIVLGFFSFAKFLMYRDLSPDVWPRDGALASQPLIQSLLQEGFPSDSTPPADDLRIDGVIGPAEMLHIVDCDSSQTLAVQDVRAGHNLVIQGPPGTGKSQTIANVIASAVADGKTVLFVAEKMAALDVVKRRLDQAGVGDACLELHSNKANKRMLLEELRRTWELGSPKGIHGSTLTRRLEDARDVLNAHVELMHHKHQPSDLSPFDVIGHLVRLRQCGQRPNDVELDGSESWSPDELSKREGLAVELRQRIETIGQPSAHAWRGVELETILPSEMDRLATRLFHLRKQWSTLAAKHEELARLLDTSAPASVHEFGAIARVSDRIATCPSLSGDALGSLEWETHWAELGNLFSTGTENARLRRSLAAHVTTEAEVVSVQEARMTLGSLPSEFSTEAFQRVRDLHVLLPRFFVEAGKLKGQLGVEEPANTLAEVSRMATTGQRVADAPNASAEVFAATVWDHGIEHAAELAEAVADLEKARDRIGEQLAPSAWATDMRAERQTLAGRGTSLLRFFSGEWRRANRAVKSHLKSPIGTLAETLELLDTLAQAQKALATIRAESSLGAAAFGTEWRGERSSSIPLRALVAWMKSLSGLGAAPRLIAARMPDRSEIGARSRAVQELINDVRPILEKLWVDLDSSRLRDFDDAINVSAARLSEVMSRVSVVAKADAVCTSVFTTEPSTLHDRVQLLDSVQEMQNSTQKIQDSAELGRAAVGQLFNGTQTEWPTCVGIMEWINANQDIRKLAARLPDREAPAALSRHAAEKLVEATSDMTRLLADLQVRFEVVFRSASFDELSLSTIVDQLDTWNEHAEQLSQWVNYRELSRRARSAGLGALVDGLNDGLVSPENSLPTFQMAYYERLFANFAGRDKALARFDGELQTRAVVEFSELDRQRIEASRVEVIVAHHRRIPPRSGGFGPLGVLRGEIARKSRLMPIRKLMSNAGQAVQALKPVLMMSPLSVAQFLPPGQLKFDLLVMDEASQIQPVDALGAIARCRQVVVVGDERQLPPTRFFSKLTTGDDEGQDEDGGAQVADIESILGLFTARGLRQRMLRWHYRSRHQSLIALSNSQFYDNKLLIIPSPYTQSAGMGLRFHHVPSGIFDSGNTGSNSIEAGVVADAIIRHTRDHPKQSLGVAAFSVKQRQAIQDRLEVLRRANPDTERFFHDHPSEPFFVKNLENVQGDERDVIFISVGYGRSSNGSLAMRFGPLNAEGGERRLNVLISRAKRRCEVFSSITDEDIDLQRSPGKGVRAFKLFLRYARTGMLAGTATSGREKNALFELQIASALRQHGYQVEPNVGIAGLFIDLAITHPDHPGRYILGIECDGGSYLEARSARDRDRLRREVLEDHGWILHRIWSGDWVQRPQEQLRRTIEAIEQAKRELTTRGSDELAPKPDESSKSQLIERAEASTDGHETGPGQHHSATAYEEATPHALAGYLEILDVPSDQLARVVESVVVVEGPVHVDEVVARVRGAWGLQRSGSRIQSAVEAAIGVSVRAKRLLRKDNFVSVPGSPVTVRDRGAVASLTLRKPEMLPPTELGTAVMQIVSGNFGASEDEIVRGVSRTLGFRATSAQLAALIQRQVSTLLRGGSLTKKGELLLPTDTQATL